MAESKESNYKLSAVQTGSLVGQKAVDVKYADVAIQFMQEHDAETPLISPEQERKLNRKLLWRVLGLTFLINLIMYMDKATLSYSSISGFWEATGLNQNKYNNVNTVFYVGFIVGQVPGTYLIQRLPLSKLIAAICFFWSLVIFLHCAAFNYAGVIVLRFFLGFFEAASIPILTTTNGMFLSLHVRESTQPIFYASCMASPIPIGFISYGVLYSKASIGDWRVLNIIIGGLTFFLSIFVYFYYPNNPIEANFLSTEEKVWTIRKVHGTTHASIEQKHFKREHAIEAFKDPISYLICGFFLLQQLANNLTYQQNLLYEEMGGLNNLNSTLVSVAGAGFAVVWSVTACIFMVFFPNKTCFTIIWTTIPALVGSIAAVALPLSNSIGELAAITLASLSFGVGWICAFGLAQTTAGSSYTKRLVRNAMVLAAYSISNIISPQIWQSRNAPKYVPAWIVQIVLSFTIAPALIGVVWYILSVRNRVRSAELNEREKTGLIKDDEGNEIEVDIATLDLTDLEDKTFIYPL
ncbi:MFS general substrate transporter [Suhomyces tanzawaensis NRRL Y-17324]|uniref:MFS general substrate transporter n=1 Tax=Suhomyces tanzawaensis NRRL Y-17324 TaxID=984487 RepID=A0A1E4SF15_9ASCO|nr:MFS general substrate transporter [Suhomyces tanzawaensis NRRL Y-17324]ODV78107.1 MFS general substrate transporter [Suhomyces tanzawaensis NRRL Y-17324]